MITRKDIAERVGVSVSVVSRALNNSGYVQKEKKDEIIRIANELGYTANPIALSLANNKTNQIVFFCNELENAFNIMLYEGMVQEGKRLGYVVMIQSDMDFSKVKSLMIDGAIIPSESTTQMYLDMIGNNYKLPIICASYGNQTSFTRSVAKVESNAYEAMNMALKYLEDNGHRKIAFLDPFDIGFIEGRLCAWKSYAAKHKLPLDEFYLGITIENMGQDSRIIAIESEKMFEVDGKRLPTSERYYAKGTLGAQLFLEKKPDATAVVAFNDEMALAFCKELIKNNVRIPDDISVIGIDGIYSRRYSNINLTSISLSPKEQGMLCVRKLIEIIQGKRIKNLNQVPLGIIEGNTVKNISK